MLKRTIIVALLLTAGLASACRSDPSPTATAEPQTATEAPQEPTTLTAPPRAQTGSAYLPLTAADAATETAPYPAPGTTPALPSPTPAFSHYDGPSLNRDGIGVQIHLHREDVDAIFGHLQTLNVGWVKVQVSWKVYEPAPGRYDEFRFDELDALVERAAADDIRVLLSVAKAPDWSRPTVEMDGPPQDPAHFQAFMRTLAARYRGRVDAYELWNEPNLRREWNGVPLSARDLVALIRAGASGAREGDANARLISGAPATTGINDGVNAVDDRVFLREMLAAGVGEVVDGVGVHPYGWANPPGASAADPGPVAPTHNDHPSFFFGDTLDDYRALLDEAGYAEMPLWATEMGWGSAEGMGGQPPAGAAFMAHVSERQQALYTLDALAMAQTREGVGPLFLWNLNFAPTFGPSFSESFYSLLRPDGTPRPVYRALQAAADRGDGD
ncbi:MAG: cellulase family glycosylhydrolase [Candidatus Promineifilaceae bacterium]|nr:cellulase family glycosylhydrolase [Candidatus Promineifilaceae bacterium]